MARAIVLWISRAQAVIWQSRHPPQLSQPLRRHAPPLSSVSWVLARLMQLAFSASKDQYSCSYTWLRVPSWSALAGKCSIWAMTISCYTKPDVLFLNQGTYYFSQFPFLTPPQETFVAQSRDFFDISNRFRWVKHHQVNKICARSRTSSASRMECVCTCFTA